MLAGVLLIASPVFSADPKTPGQGANKSKPSISNRPVVTPREDDPERKEKGKPESPGRPGRIEPPVEVSALVDRFQSARETYLREQRELRIRLKSASEEEREAIRAEIRESLERWKEQHRQFALETKVQAQHLKETLHPDFGRVIDRGKDEGR